MKWIVPVAMALSLLCSSTMADEREAFRIALGMALPDSAGGKPVFYDRGGERLLLDLVDYPTALAEGGLCPDKVMWGDRSVAIGHHEASLIRKLGDDYREIERPNEKTPDSTIVYFRQILLKHPNTLWFYLITEMQEHSGWYHVLEWDLPGERRTHPNAYGAPAPLRFYGSLPRMS